MRKLCALTLAALALLASPTVDAQPKLIGKKAPKFAANYTPVNLPKANTLDECLGDVVLIKAWGIQ